MAGISAPAVPTEPWRGAPSHEDIAVSNKDSLLENQRGYSASGPSGQKYPVPMKRKMRRKDKTGMEVACAWVVEHQTGWAYGCSPILIAHALTPRRPRSKLTIAPLLHPRLLPSVEALHSKILQTFILQ
jgi:hypothetical protein